MILCCIKRSRFPKNNNIKKKREIVGQINLYSYCYECGFKKFETIVLIEKFEFETKFLMLVD